MTRAMLSLFVGNWSQYVYYNAMALPMCAALVTAIFWGKRKGRKWLWGGVGAILLLNFVYYVYRLILYFEGGSFPP